MHTIDQARPFVQSHIWQLQRDYFNTVGISAWSQGEVPHYISSNPVMGKAYAEMVLAFLRDLSLKGQTEETVYLIELGAGHGRLCHHFFMHFEKYYTKSAFPLPPFCYILSDFTRSNIDFWTRHPRLHTYCNKGLLDFALFDAEKTESIHLEHRNTTIEIGELSQPLIVIGNYFFDTIPQSLYWMSKEKLALPMLGLTSETDPDNLSSAELIKTLQLDYTYEAIPSLPYPDSPILQSVFASYRDQFEDTHLLFPDIGIQCLERLRALSKSGLLLLAADKGRYALEHLDHHPAPSLTKHGSFSLSVNFHAFIEYCRLLGGHSIFPDLEPASLVIGSLLILPKPETYLETITAYDRYINDYNPDDFFYIKKLLENRFDTLSYKQMLATLRLSGYDAHFYLQMHEHLKTIALEITQQQRQDLRSAAHRIWQTYYPLGESTDVSFALGEILLVLEFYKEALPYFKLSNILHGEKGITLFNIVTCHCSLGDFAKATPIIAELWTISPNNESLKALIQQFDKELAGV
jgi:hypothetical protein